MVKHLGWVLVLMAACGDGGGSEMKATATFAGINGQTVTGTGEFTLAGDKVTATFSFTAAPAGVHGMHIHANAACTAEGMDAGAHWDTTGAGAPGHGLPPAGHIGDLGNITISAAGTGTLTHSNAEWTLGDGAATDVLPHAIILHELMDDGSMPSSGGRWGCALIVMQN